MNRLICFFMALLLLICLCACTEAPEETVTLPSLFATNPTAATEEKDPQLGQFADGVYINDFLGIRCAVDEAWSVYSESQLAQLNGLVLNTMTDADLVAQLKKANVAHLFYATADGGHRSVNVVLENIGLINGVLLNEQTYVELAVEQLPAALESMGLTEVTAEAVTVPFTGSQHWAVQVRGMLSGIHFYEQVVCIKVGRYFGIVTVASYHEDRTGDLLNMFTDNEKE